MSESAESAQSNRYIVGAYAASPAHRDWNPTLEREFLHALAALPNVGGLEMPWLGSLHPHDDAWMLENFPTTLSAVITDIPFTMMTLGSQPHFGLASRDDAGRQAALAAVEEVRAGALRLNEAQQRRVVSTVELHSAPRRHNASADAFAASLAEIASWEWDGAELVVEHCDAEVEGLKPEKGFLTLEEEIAAIRASGADIGISLNWGRSAIEFRDADRAVEHVKVAADSGLLRGMIISGASDKDGAFGPAWIDAHHPFQRSAAHPFGDPVSLLTEGRAAQAFAAAGELAWSGAKVGFADPAGSVADRVQMVSQALASLK